MTVEERSVLADASTREQVVAGRVRPLERPELEDEIVRRLAQKGALERLEYWMPGHVDDVGRTRTSSVLALEAVIAIERVVWEDDSEMIDDALADWVATQ